MYRLSGGYYCQTVFLCEQIQSFHRSLALFRKNGTRGRCSLRSQGIIDEQNRSRVRFSRQKSAFPHECRSGESNNQRRYSQGPQQYQQPFGYPHLAHPLLLQAFQEFQTAEIHLLETLAAEKVNQQRYQRRCQSGENSGVNESQSSTSPKSKNSTKPTMICPAVICPS